MYAGYFGILAAYAPYVIGPIIACIHFNVTLGYDCDW